jgi:hypothetical protein
MTELEHSTLCSCCWGGSSKREVWSVSNQITFPQKVHYALLRQQINLQLRTFLSSPFFILSSFRNFPHHRFDLLIPFFFFYRLYTLFQFLFLVCTSSFPYLFSTSPYYFFLSILLISFPNSLSFCLSFIPYSSHFSTYIISFLPHTCHLRCFEVPFVVSSLFLSS